MPRDEFLRIMNSLKICDPQHESITDNLSKVRPMLDHFNQAAATYYVPEGDLAFDEMSPGYSGRYNLVKLTPNKKVPSGIQTWAVADTHGIVLRLEFLFDSVARKKNDPAFTNTQNSILRVLSVVPAENKFHTVYFDNLFTSPSIFIEIYRRYKLYCVGTWRTNFGVPKILKQGKVTKANAKRIRDAGNDTLRLVTSSQRVVGKTNSTLPITLVGCSFIDMQAVHMLSTRPFKYTKMVGGVKSKVRLDIQHAYNSGMNKVDVADQLWNRYSTYMISKKWRKSIFYFLLDIAISNSWKYYNIPRKATGNGRTLSHKQFMLILVENLLKRASHLEKRNFPSSPPVKTRKRPRRSSMAQTKGFPEFLVRNHHGWPEETTKRRCLMCFYVGGIRKEVRIQCSECRVALCIDCFRSFHNDSNVHLKDI